MTIPPPGAPRLRTLVVGGGIGGLTAAAALARHRVEVRVVEQAERFQAVGAGITLQANATAVLRALGIALPIEAVLPIGDVAILDGRGRALTRGDAGAILPDPPSVSIHRADLHDALLAACDGVPIETGRRVVGAAPDPDGVEVAFADGDRERFDLVVGADGIRSAIRQSLVGEDDADLRYSGQTCWRFAVAAAGRPLESASERWLPGRRIGLVPLARGRVYAYLVESAPRGTPGPGTASPDALRARFGGIDPYLDALLERLDAAVPVDHSDLFDRTRIHFGRGRAVLIGDAAHPMTPNLGQGAGTAIEDVAALVLALADGAAGAAALPRAVDALRRERVTAVQRAAWRIGRVSHWRHPVACALRDALVRAVPDSAAHRRVERLWQPGIALAERLRALPEAGAPTPGGTGAGRR